MTMIDLYLQAKLEKWFQPVIGAIYWFGKKDTSNWKSLEKMEALVMMVKSIISQQLKVQ